MFWISSYSLEFWQFSIILSVILRRTLWFRSIFRPFFAHNWILVWRSSPSGTKFTQCLLRWTCPFPSPRRLSARKHILVFRVGKSSHSAVPQSFRCCRQGADVICFYSSSALARQHCFFRCRRDTPILLRFAVTPEPESICHQFRHSLKISSPWLRCISFERLTKQRIAFSSAWGCT